MWAFPRFQETVQENGTKPPRAPQLEETPETSPRGNPACRGTFGGRRKAVRDRLALPKRIPAGRPAVPPSPCPSEENRKIGEVGCKPGKTRVNQGGRLAASDPEGKAGFAGLPKRIPAGRPAVPPSPCPPVHPCSPAFADPGGGCRPGPERAERSLALVLLGQGLCRAGRVRGSRDSGSP